MNTTNDSELSTDHHPLIPPGYKQTEVGVIPEDWEVIDLSHLCTLQRGFDITEATRAPGTVPVYSSSGLSYYHAKAMVSPPGIVTGRKGILGKVFLINEPFWPHDTTLWVKDFRGNHPAYVALVLQHFHLERLDAATSVPTLNRNNLAGHPTALPPTIAEQEAIAEALSDADALIESLEKLIVKKRQIKQGAMQELLTGKKRLPGFSGEWEVRRLEELAEIRSGGTPSTTQPQFWDGDVLWCTPTDITALKDHKYLTETSRTITVHGLKYSSAEMIPLNSIVMTSRATIGECAINKAPVSTNQGFKNFVPFEAVDAEFLYYLLLTKRQDFISLCGGSTFLEIGKTQLAIFEVRLPSTKAEQTAIATILSDMDAEIAALEAKLAKARQLKQGMMQVLLTGRIRLV
jgi:type I restriction enzyme, S subunit